MGAARSRVRSAAVLVVLVFATAALSACMDESGSKSANEGKRGRTARTASPASSEQPNASLVSLTSLSWKDLHEKQIVLLPPAGRWAVVRLVMDPSKWQPGSTDTQRSVRYLITADAENATGAFMVSALRFSR